MPHGATGICTGVLGETLTGLDLGATFTDVPGGTANWTLANANYTAVSASVDIDISQADPDCTVSGYSGTYDGTAHGANRASAWACSARRCQASTSARASLTSRAAPPTGPSPTCTGNYTDDSGSVDIDITKASPDLHCQRCLGRV